MENNPRTVTLVADAHSGQQVDIELAEANVLWVTEQSAYDLCATCVEAADYGGGSVAGKSVASDVAGVDGLRPPRSAGHVQKARR